MIVIPQLLNNYEHNLLGHGAYNIVMYRLNTCSVFYVSIDLVLHPHVRSKKSENVKTPKMLTKRVKIEATLKKKILVHFHSCFNTLFGRPRKKERNMTFTC